MMGRPQVKIDLAQLENLYAMFYTDCDVAYFFGCSVRTIERRKHVPDFLEAVERGRAKARVKLRMALIFLGKLYLGQTNNGVAERTGSGGGPKDFDIRARLSRLLGRRAEHAEREKARAAA